MSHVFRFGDFVVDDRVRELRRAGEPIALQPQVFDVLLYLVEHRDELVTKNDLLDNVWGDRFVSESALSTRIKEVRRAIGDTGTEQAMLRTVYGRGFRWVIPTEISDDALADDQPVSGTTPREIGAPSAERHNLPVDRTPLLGRRLVVHDVATRVRDGRLVSVLGIGGMGKTRVAVAAAAELLGEFDDGVWLVDLAPASYGADVAEAMAAAAGYHVTGQDLVASLIEALRHRDVVFVLDNCEQATDAVAGIVDAVLTSTTGVRFLVTSREPLGLLDEHQLTLEPLDVTSDADSPAIELFVSTAARVGARLGEDEVDVIASLCRQLDGHPLSIELAAAQLRQLTLIELAERLEDRFDLLSRGHSSGRQVSLASVLADTWRMLSADETRLLVQLGSFPSSFGLDEIEQIVSGLEVGSVGRTLGGLVDRNLVVSDHSGTYGLLETVKLFARRHDDADDAAERHTAWMRSVLRSGTDATRFTSMALAEWLSHHDDDWRAVEDRLAISGRWSELAELFRDAAIYFQQRIPGAAAMAQIRRIEHYLGRIGAEDETTSAVLHLVAAYSGSSARRPDWIERGGAHAVELTAGSASVDRALALVPLSWITAMRDADAAVASLAEAVEVAEASGAIGLADVAIAYQGVHLALDGRIDDAVRILDDLERRLDDHDLAGEQFGSYLALTLRIAVSVVHDPAASKDAADRRAALFIDSPADFGVLDAAACAAVGDVAGARWRMDEALQTWRRSNADDGLPDWLVPLAVMAHQRQDIERCRTLVTAIRRSSAPLHNLLHTIVYRQLRQLVGADPDDGDDEIEIGAVFDEAMRWTGALVD